MNASRGLITLWTRHTGALTCYANDEFGDTGMNRGDRDPSGEVEDGSEPRSLSEVHWIEYS